MAGTHIPDSHAGWPGSEKSQVNPALAGSQQALEGLPLNQIQTCRVSKLYHLTESWLLRLENGAELCRAQLPVCPLSPSGIEFCTRSLLSSFLSHPGSDLPKVIELLTGTGIAAQAASKGGVLCFTRVCSREAVREGRIGTVAFHPLVSLVV